MLPLLPGASSGSASAAAISCSPRARTRAAKLLTMNRRFVERLERAIASGKEEARASASGLARPLPCRFVPLLVPVLVPATRIIMEHSGALFDKDEANHSGTGRTVRAIRFAAISKVCVSQCPKIDLAINVDQAHTNIFSQN